MSDYPRYIHGQVEISVNANEVLISAPLTNGIRPFTIHLTRERATELGHRLISESLKLLPPTTKTGEI